MGKLWTSIVWLIRKMPVEIKLCIVKMPTVLFFGSDKDEKCGAGKRQTEECLIQHGSKKATKSGCVAKCFGSALLGSSASLGSSAWDAQLGLGPFQTSSDRLQYQELSEKGWS